MEYFPTQVRKRQLSRTLKPSCVVYIQHLYNTRAAHGHAVFSVLSLQHFQTHLDGHLKMAWRSVQSWKAEMPTSMRTPVPEAMMHVYFLVALMFAFQYEPGSFMA